MKPLRVALCADFPEERWPSMDRVADRLIAYLRRDLHRRSHMSSFTVPPLPGENLLGVGAVAARAGCSREAIYNAIEYGKISAVKVAGRLAIAESEVERFLRAWRGPSPKWAEYRRWRAAHQEAAGRAVA